MNKYLWIIPFFSFLSGYLLMNLLYQGNVVTAPQLIGCSAQEALCLAAQKKLNVRLIEEKEDSELPAGTIISQNPLPNSSMKAQQTILCGISKKAQRTVPNLLGKNLDDIMKEFKGLPVKIKSYYIESTQPCGTCIAQNPYPGSLFDGKNSIIVYIAQSNAKCYLFPDFMQKPVNEVLDFLERSGLQAQVTHLQETKDGHSCSDCIVSDQVPLSGSPIIVDTDKLFVVQLYVTEVEPSTERWHEYQ